MKANSILSTATGLLLVTLMVSCQSSGRVSTRSGDAAPAQSMMGRIDSAKQRLSQLNSAGLVPTVSYQKMVDTLTAVHLEITDCDKKLRSQMLAANDIRNELRLTESEVASSQSKLETQKPALAVALADQNTLQDQMASLERESEQLQKDYRSALEAFKESATTPNGQKLINARIKYEVQEKLVAEHAKRKQIVATKLTKKKQDFLVLDQSRIQAQNLLSRAEEKRQALVRQKIQLESDTRNAQKKLNDALARAQGVLCQVEDQIGKFATSKLPGTADPKKKSLMPTETRTVARQSATTAVTSARPVPRDSLRDVSVERIIEIETIVADDDELKRK
jgi:chromosome segregation ATPase